MTPSKGALTLNGEPMRTRNKDYLKKRFAWRIQELAEGGLSQGALARIHQLGAQMPERWRMRQNQGHGASDAPAPTELRLDPGRGLAEELRGVGRPRGELAVLHRIVNP